MSNLQNKYIVPLVSCILVLGFISYKNIQARDVEVKEIEVQYAEDFSKDEILVGASHNIFVGKVIRQIGTKERGIGGETQFEIVVIDNIKGDLKGKIVVNQQGGYRDRTLYVVGNADASNYMLKQGGTYLFATRYNEQEDWHTLNSYPTASKLLSLDKGLEIAELRTLAQGDMRFVALKGAYPKEIVLDADIRSNKALNNYKEIQAKKSTSTEEAI